MTTVTLRSGASAYALAARPQRRHGGAARMPVDSGAAESFFHFPIGSRVPAGAVILSATWRVFQAKSAWTGTHTLTAQRVGKWRATGLKWANRPAVSGTAVSMTRTDSANGSAWEFDVTADVIAWQNGTVTNYGWKLSTTSATRRYVRGFLADTKKPELVVEYAVKPAKATDMRPGGGVIGTTEPVLTFSGGGFSSFRVQVSKTSDFAVLDHDQTVTSTSPRFDLATSAFVGDTAERFWRVELISAAGSSGWSSTSSWTYAAPPTPTITAPASTVADPSALTQWTVTGQVERNVIYRDADGRTLEESGWETTADLVYAPSWTVGDPGDYSVEVRVRDALEREAVDGFPDYGTATKTYAYARSTTLAAVAGLSAVQIGPSPWVRLSWSRVEAADEWTIVHDGVEVARVASADTVQTDPTAHRYTFMGATPNRPNDFQVLPVVNSEVGSASPVATLTPDVEAVWIGEPATGLQAVLWNTSEPDLADRENATVFETADGGVVRWVHQTFGPADELEGLLADVAGYPTSDESRDALLAWATQPTAELLLIVPPMCLPVGLGDIGVGSSRLDSEYDRVHPARLSFYTRKRDA